MASGRQVEELIPEQLRGMTPEHGAREVMKQRELRKLLLSLRTCRFEGAVMEFGVGSGATLANLVEFIEAWDMPNMSYGFDSFQGLPKDEGQWRKGWFSFPRDYTEKSFEGLTNYRLIDGFFEDSLTPELREELAISYASLILVDCDLYSSAVTVLEWVKPLLLPGTFIVFDEWGYGEDQAWEEFVATTNVRYQWLDIDVPDQKVLKVFRAP